MTTQGVINWDSEQVAGGASVVLKADKGHTNIVYCKDQKSFAWRPTELPYNANWDSLSHDGEKFIIADSGNSRLQATSVDGKTWFDAGT